jgi:hypothetical protein
MPINVRHWKRGYWCKKIIGCGAGCSVGALVYLRYNGIWDIDLLISATWAMSVVGFRV